MLTSTLNTAADAQSPAIAKAARRRLKPHSQQPQNHMQGNASQQAKPPNGVGVEAASPTKPNKARACGTSDHTESPNPSHAHEHAQRSCRRSESCHSQSRPTKPRTQPKLLHNNHGTMRKEQVSRATPADGRWDHVAMEATGSLCIHRSLQRKRAQALGATMIAYAIWMGSFVESSLPLATDVHECTPASPDYCLIDPLLHEAGRSWRIEMIRRRMRRFTIMCGASRIAFSGSFSEFVQLFVKPTEFSGRVFFQAGRGPSEHSVQNKDEVPTALYK